jgi:hypothetical protein
MALLPFLITGCFFNLSAKKDFSSWYYGDPGMAGALGEAGCDRYADKIQGPRHPYYLHFRTPEVLLQPQGGGRYPERTTAEGRTGGPEPTAPSCEQVAKGWETFSFDTVDAGLVDMVIPYRKASTVNDREDGFGQAGLNYAGAIVYNIGLAAVMKAPIYIVHDLLKTLYIPVAGTYYLFKPDPPPVAPPGEISRMREEPLAADLQSGTGLAGAAPGAGASADKATNAAVSAVDAAETGMTTFGLLAANEDAVVVVSPEESESLPADEAPVVPHRMLPTPKPVVTETPASRSTQGGGGKIVEQDLSEAMTAATEGDAAEDRGAVSSRPGEVEVAPPAQEQPAAPASVVPAPQAGAGETPAVRGPEKEVRIAKRKLRKRVAFLGFHSRNINVDDETRDDLEGFLWPVFEEECSRKIDIVRRGDANYPSALDFLVRDPFGRLNSFELTTVARFSGLNAIIVGTIFDVRVANKISGILWYKSPEGRLRFTAMVEVYDAETGTKLFDQTYVRDEEVEELDPGADENLRSEDQATLEAVLRSVAEEMGEQVCEALDDQPWRAFVTAIDGDRVTLSAGQSAGLAPGNILAVYNSQIIDGLNNQQFFLTGERVGRIQIQQVFANRSEAILIEGRGLRDYSVAIPE